MNCHPTFCGMLVEVEGGRLKTISGDKDNPDSQGFLCVRGRSTNEIFGNPSRLLYPQIREAAGRPPRLRGERLLPLVARLPNLAQTLPPRPWVNLGCMAADHCADTACRAIILIWDLNFRTRDAIALGRQLSVRQRPACRRGERQIPCRGTSRERQS
jgi:hypothetical protein